MPGFRTSAVPLVDSLLLRWRSYNEECSDLGHRLRTVRQDQPPYIQSFLLCTLTTRSPVNYTLNAEQGGTLTAACITCERLWRAWILPPNPTLSQRSLSQTKRLARKQHNSLTKISSLCEWRATPRSGIPTSFELGGLKVCQEDELRLSFHTAKATL